MKRPGGPGPQRGNHSRAQRYGRYEMSIHDVDMDDFGMLLDQLDLVSEMSEVGREDRCGELSHSAYRTGPPASYPRFVNAATNIPSLPFRCGHSRTRGAAPSGPSTMAGSKPGRCRRMASQAASVSARGKVQTE